MSASPFIARKTQVVYQGSEEMDDEHHYSEDSLKVESKEDKTSPSPQQLRNTIKIAEPKSPPHTKAVPMFTTRINELEKKAKVLEETRKEKAKVLDINKYFKDVVDDKVKEAAYERKLTKQSSGSALAARLR